MPDQSSAATEHAILQEITAPLETLPDDPLSVIEADFPHALRGYDRLAVDEYVQRTRRLVAELQATRSPEAAVRRALQRVGDQISGVLQRAHETAEQITSQSRSEAEDRLQQARAEAQHIADAADRHVRDLDADTDRIWLERQRIVADAEDLAAQLLALAKVAAERFPIDEAEGEGYGGAEGQGEVPEDELAPYDEAELAPYDEAALIAGVPVEAGAPEGEADPSVDADPPVDADSPVEDDSLLEEDVTRTVAFAPLPDPEAQTTILPAVDEPAQGAVGPPEGALDPPPARRPSPRKDDSTGVIRPASQAANRRLGR